MIFPGLLQIEEYARALIALEPSYSQVDIDDSVSVRLKRQERLHDDDPVKLSVIVSEAALVQRWSGLGTHLAQLEHVLEISEQDNVQLRVLAFDSPPGSIANSSTLAFLSFESKYLPTVAFQEVVRLLDPVHGSSDFRRLELCWNDGQERALSLEESRRRVEAIYADLSRKKEGVFKATDKFRR